MDKVVMDEVAMVNGDTTNNLHKQYIKFSRWVFGIAGWQRDGLELSMSWLFA